MDRTHQVGGNVGNGRVAQCVGSVRAVRQSGPVPGTAQHPAQVDAVGRITSVRTAGGHRRWRESDVRALVAELSQVAA